MNKQDNSVLLVVALVALLLLRGSAVGGGVTKVTYVYDKSQGSIPSEVLVAIDELNHDPRKIVASSWEVDPTVPEQYRVADAAAKAESLPLLVVQSGDKVKRTLRAPTKRDQVIEAAK